MEIIVERRRREFQGSIISVFNRVQSDNYLKSANICSGVVELDKMLFTRFISDREITALTAVYNGRAAVFYQYAPAENNPKWANAKVQYPRIDYNLDMMEDPARNTSGTLVINVWCDKSKGQEPEAIEARIRAMFHATFAQPDDGMPYCFVWQRTDAFEATLQSEQTAYAVGCTVIFDLMAFPSQYTTIPDPIQAVNAWTKTVLPNAIVIGEDTFNGWITPTQAQPIVYWRIMSQAVFKRTHVCAWFNAVLEGHVFAQGVSERTYVIRTINTAAALAHHITMEDRSPMFIMEFNINTNVNYLMTGQMQARTRYGILQGWYAKPQERPKLNHVNIPREIVTNGIDVERQGEVERYKFLYAAAGTAQANDGDS